jgi:hypothetical protein
VSVRPYKGSFEPVGVVHGVTLHIEPLAAEARPVRSRGHRVKHDSRMLGWPQRPVGAVDVLVLGTQFLALIPQPACDVRAGRRHLPRNPRGHLLGRKHRVEVGPPRACRPLRRGPGDNDLGSSGRVVKIHGSFPIQAARPEVLLPAPVGARPLRHPSHPANVGLAHRPVGAWRRRLMKQLDSTRGGPGTGTFSSAVDSRPVAGPQRPGIRRGTRCSSDPATAQALSRSKPPTHPDQP